MLHIERIYAIRKCKKKTRKKQQNQQRQRNSEH